jgi:hypothetical protein
MPKSTASSSDENKKRRVSSKSLTLAILRNDIRQSVIKALADLRHWFNYREVPMNRRNYTSIILAAEAGAKSDTLDGLEDLANGE